MDQHQQNSIYCMYEFDNHKSKSDHDVLMNNICQNGFNAADQEIGMTLREICHVCFKQFTENNIDQISNCVNNKSINAQIWYGYYHFLKGQYDEMRKYYAIPLSKNNADVLFYTGLYYEIVGDNDQAFEYYIKSINF